MVPGQLQPLHPVAVPWTSSALGGSQRPKRLVGPGSGRGLLGRGGALLLELAGHVDGHQDTERELCWQQR